MYFNPGKNVFDSEEDVRACVVYMSGMDEEDFGKIKLARNHAIVEVREEYVRDVIDALIGQDYQDTTLTARPARR